MMFARRRTQTPEETTRRRWLLGHGSAASAMDVILDEPVFTGAGAITPTAMAFTLRQLATATTAGQTVTATLPALAQAHAGTAVGHLCLELADATSRGLPLSEAVASRPHIFGPGAAALIRAGERTGDLGYALNAAAGDLEEDVRLARDTRTVLIYPLMSAAVVTALALALALVCGPLLSTVELGRPLPLMSRALLTLATWTPALAVLAVAAVLTYRTMGNVPALADMVRARRDRVLAAVPGLAGVTKQHAHARLARTLAWLLRAGLSPAHALALAAPACGNTRYQEAAVRAADQVEAGTPLSQALAAEDLLNHPLAQVVAAGEGMAASADLLESYAGLATLEGDRAVRALCAVVEPLACALAGLVLLLWLTGLVLPVLLASAGLG